MDLLPWELIEFILDECGWSAYYVCILVNKQLNNIAYYRLLREHLPNNGDIYWHIALWATRSGYAELIDYALDHSPELRSQGASIRILAVEAVAKGKINLVDCMKWNVMIAPLNDVEIPDRFKFSNFRKFGGYWAAGMCGEEYVLEWADKLMKEEPVDLQTMARCQILGGLLQAGYIEKFHQLSVCAQTDKQVFIRDSYTWSIMISNVTNRNSLDWYYSHSQVTYLDMYLRILERDNDTMFWIISCLAKQGNTAFDYCILYNSCIEARNLIFLEHLRQYDPRWKVEVTVRAVANDAVDVLYFIERVDDTPIDYWSAIDRIGGSSVLEFICQRTSTRPHKVIRSLLLHDSLELIQPAFEQGFIIYNSDVEFAREHCYATDPKVVDWMEGVAQPD
jgi:hypothetical protein